VARNVNSARLLGLGRRVWGARDGGLDRHGSRVSLRRARCKGLVVHLCVALVCTSRWPRKRCTSSRAQRTPHSPESIDVAPSCDVARRVSLSRPSLPPLPYV
jgi:hypothetical protein